MAAERRGEVSLRATGQTPYPVRRACDIRRGCRWNRGRDRLREMNAVALRIAVLTIWAPCLCSAGEGGPSSNEMAQWRGNVLGRVRLPPIETVASPTTTVVRLWIQWLLPSKIQVHQLIGSGVEPAQWTFIEAVGTNRTQLDLTGAAPYVWRGAKTLSLLELPDQRSLPDDGAKIWDGIVCTVDVSEQGKTRTYSYDNPAYHHRPEDQNLACIVDLLGGVAQRAIDSSRQMAVDRRLVAEKKDADLDSLVGRTFKTLVTKSRGAYSSVRIIRREGQEYIVEHSSGVMRIRCRDVLENDGEVQH
jgi:hypothetical protein